MGRLRLPFCYDAYLPNQSRLAPATVEAVFLITKCVLSDGLQLLIQGLFLFENAGRAHFVVHVSLLLGSLDFILNILKATYTAWKNARETKKRTQRTADKL